MDVRTKIGEFLGRFAPIPRESTDLVTTKGVTIEKAPVDETPPFYDIATLPRSLYDLSDRDSGLDSNVVMAPVMWIMRTFVEAQVVVQRRRFSEDGLKAIWEPVIDHPVELLLEQPNPAYDGDILWQATLVSFILAGNAYWRKIRNAIGDVVELWYIPHFLMTPKAAPGRYLDYYEYRPESGMSPERIAPRDVVHFRFGQDPRNTRLGLSPLRPLLREVFTDDEAAIFSAAILKNMGVPGLVISPKDVTRPLSPTDVQEVKADMNTTVRGSRRGSTKVFGVPTDVQQFGFDPNQLSLTNLRDIAEERVCSMLGLPATVVGFGSGVQATKVGATMREWVKLARVGCLSPMQSSLAKQGTRQLLPDFVSQTRRFRIWFDTSEVPGFQEDDTAVADRIVKIALAGLMRVDRAQSALGLEVDDSQKVYLRPSNTVVVDENGEVIESEQKPAPQQDPEEQEVPSAIAARMGNGNGNGNQVNSSS